MLGQLIDSETHSPSLVSSFLQPPISRVTGGLFRDTTNCLFCRPTSSFLCCLEASAHHSAQGRGPSALPPQWPYPGHPCLGFGRLGGNVLWAFGNRECSVESFLLRRLLNLPVPETLTDGCRPGDPQVTSRLERVPLSTQGHLEVNQLSTVIAMWQ